MFGLGTTELILIVFVIVLLFGAKKIPDLAKGLGESVRHLRKALKDEDDTKAKK
ncbi:MAG: twin-arginine translocase TatA/TatE family subunit [Candidatus Moranbacteria bacterium]|nr:twin-arginine translocase TatA/TatE family subunit [Candidatus Moranbacteria bacterium]